MPLKSLRVLEPQAKSLDIGENFPTEFKLGRHQIGVTPSPFEIFCEDQRLVLSLSDLCILEHSFKHRRIGWSVIESNDTVENPTIDPTTNPAMVQCRHNDGIRQESINAQVTQCMRFLGSGFGVHQISLPGGSGSTWPAE